MSVVREYLPQRFTMPYAELHCLTNFSFLEGASHADELAARAAELGYAALAVTDRNTLAGAVKAHVAAKEAGLKLVVGAEITLQTPIGRYLKDVEIAQAAAEQISSLSNVTCDVEQRDFASYVQDLLTGNIEDKPHFGLLGWGNGEFDASQTIGPLLTTDGALTTYKDPDVDELLDELIYNRLYSLVWEYGHHWVDMRRYDRLLQIPTTPNDPLIVDAMPIPENECTPRNPRPDGCGAIAPVAQ